MLCWDMQEFLYHVATLVQHGLGLFPGTNIEGSRWYFQILAGEADGTAQLEIGWGGSPHSGGTSDAFLFIIKSFTLDMVCRKLLNSTGHFAFVNTGA